MTEPTASSAPPPATKASFWEDLIDIYFKPADVFRRRQHTSVWPPMLFVALSVAIIFFVTYNTLQPLFDAEFSRNTAKMMEKNPQLTQEMMDRTRSFGEAVTKYGVGVIMLLTMFVVGVLTWVLGKVVGSKQTFHAALVVAAWAYMPRVLGTVIGGIQGLMMDPANLTSQLSISLSPARFYDPDTTNAVLYQFLGRLDLITIWVTVLLAIGVYVTGKISKERAFVFGLLIWIVGAIPAVRQAYISM